MDQATIMSVGEQVDGQLCGCLAGLFLARGGLGNAGVGGPERHGYLGDTGAAPAYMLAAWLGGFEGQVASCLVIIDVRSTAADP